MKNHGSRGGYTLVELALSMLLLLLVVGVPVRFMESVADAQSELDAVTRLNARAARVLEQVTQRLQGADVSTVNPPPGPGGSFLTTWVDFKVPTGFQAGAATLPANPETLEFEDSPADPVNGVDDDGDGLVDEGRVAWRNPPLTRVLCNDVPRAAAGEIAGNGLDDDGDGFADEPGFHVVIDFDSTVGKYIVRASLTLIDVDADGNRITATAEQNIALRCRPLIP